MKQIENKTTEELQEDLDKIFIGKEAYALGKSLPQKVLKDLFNLYNSFYGASEYSYFCGSCRSKVWKGIGPIEVKILEILDGRKE